MSRFSVRPDLTPAQVIGVAVAGIPILASITQAFGIWTATPAELDSLNQAGQWAIATSGVLFIGDAAIRVGRNVAQGRVDAAVHNAEGNREAAAAAATIATVASSPATTLGEPITGTLGEVRTAGASPLVDDETELASPPPAAAGEPPVDDDAIGARMSAVAPEEVSTDES